MFHHNSFKKGKLVMKTILPFIIFLFILISCSETAVDPPLKVSITTESTSAVYETWAMLNIKNETSRDVYLIHTSDRIGFWKLQKAFKDSWVDVRIDTVIYNNLI